MCDWVSYHYQVDKELFIAAEGMYTGQAVYCGKKAEVGVGNVLPLRELPEGTVVCNVEFKVGDRGCLARCSGDYATVIGHSDDKSSTFLRLPSGIKKTVLSRWVVSLFDHLKLPRDGGHRCWRRSYGQADAEGGSQLPQVQSEAQRVAEGERRVHEPCGPSSWRR